MKQHTQDFKNAIKDMGRQLKHQLTYSNTTLEDELFDVTISYEGNILKSVMKQIEVESSVDIPLGTVVGYRLGVLVNSSYEYLDYGNYIVYKSEKSEDTDTYILTCYDKILLSMKDYVNIGVVYPITIRDYITALCTYLGITFANSSTTFANWNKIIPNEKYLDASGNDIGYTFRDVLDELAQVTGSTICINADDELEIRYITNSLDTIDEEFLKDVNVKFGEKYRTS